MNASIEEELQTFPASVRVAGVKVRDLGEVKKMGCGDVHLAAGDYVMMELDDDLTYGVVYNEPQTMPFIPQMRVMSTILRKATEDDRDRIQKQEELAQAVTDFCRERVTALGLRMKLVEVVCSLTRREVLVMYTSEERVDFRQLVKDLGRRFGARIEMRHIGARDESQRLSGVDTCGLILCCAAFLTEFRPVSVKKAKSQGVPIEESRLTGVCGRLKCCLIFEEQESSNGHSSAPELIQPTRSSL